MRIPQITGEFRFAPVAQSVWLIALPTAYRSSASLLACVSVVPTVQTGELPAVRPLAEQSLFNRAPAGVLQLPVSQKKDRIFTGQRNSSFAANIRKKGFQNRRFW